VHRRSRGANTALIVAAAVILDIVHRRGANWLAVVRPRRSGAPWAAPSLPAPFLPKRATSTLLLRAARVPVAAIAATPVRLRSHHRRFVAAGRPRIFPLPAHSVSRKEPRSVWSASPWREGVFP
jgi:hypothetical protein